MKIIAISLLALPAVVFGSERARDHYAEFADNYQTAVIDQHTEYAEELAYQELIHNDAWEATKYWAEEYDVDPDFAVCVMRNESGGRPFAKGDGGLAVGIFQFHLPTWRSFRRLMGLPAEDLRTDIYESARTAMWAFADGRINNWTARKYCYD